MFLLEGSVSLLMEPSVRAGEKPNPIWRNFQRLREAHLSPRSANRLGNLLLQCQRQNTDHNIRTFAHKHGALEMITMQELRERQKDQNGQVFNSKTAIIGYEEMCLETHQHGTSTGPGDQV